jgi:hypothetical protein
MKVIAVAILTLIISCAHHEEKQDIMDKLIAVHKTDEIHDLKVMFGEPDEIKSDPRVPAETTWFYRRLNFECGISKKTNKIVGTALYLSGDFAHYAYLKKRFGKYEWNEIKQIPIKTDYANDLRRVEIPELGIVFHYDNQDPQRHAAEIFFH